MDNTDPNNTPKQYHTLIIFLFVFFSGFASLATEIIGPRLFSSLFGYTTQIWAAIISVTLLGISLGYYFGGRVPRQRIAQLLPIVLIVNAIWLLGISWLIWSVPIALLQFGFISVLLVAGLAFLVPAMLFSFASPMSITLLSENRSPEWIDRQRAGCAAGGFLPDPLGWPERLVENLCHWRYIICHLFLEQISHDCTAGAGPVLDTASTQLPLVD
jgi:predicted membrane-bound spermidine synthase